MKFSTLRTYIRFRGWGKYLITILIFLIVFLFIGNQSLVQCSKRKTEIRHYEKQTRKYKKEIKGLEQTLQEMNEKETLEKYAREHYYMHNTNEEIYIVEEK